MWRIARVVASGYPHHVTQRGKTNLKGRCPGYQWTSPIYLYLVGFSVGGGYNLKFNKDSAEYLEKMLLKKS